MARKESSLELLVAHAAAARKAASDLSERIAAIEATINGLPFRKDVIIHWSPNEDLPSDRAVLSVGAKVLSAGVFCLVYKSIADEITVPDEIKVSQLLRDLRAKWVGEWKPLTQAPVRMKVSASRLLPFIIQMLAEYQEEMTDKILDSVSSLDRTLGDAISVTKEGK